MRAGSAPRLIAEQHIDVDQPRRTFEPDPLALTSPLVLGELRTKANPVRHRKWDLRVPSPTPAMLRLVEHQASSRSTRELLADFAAILRALCDRGVIRTNNNPIGVIAQAAR